MTSTKSMTRARTELIEAVGHSVARQRSGRGAMFNSRMAEVLGLNLTDLKCFDLLLRSPEPVSGKRLADLSGLTTASITGVTDRLEAGGFVRRVAHPTDRRQLIIEPQPEAAARVQALYVPLQRAMRALAESYTDEELAVILDYQQRATQVLAEATEQLGQE